MLVLTRREGETIVLNPGTEDESRVTILDVSGNRVRVGVEAPKSTVVHREEIIERRKR